MIIVQRHARCLGVSVIIQLRACGTIAARLQTRKCKPERRRRPALAAAADRQRWNVPATLLLPNCPVNDEFDTWLLLACAVKAQLPFPCCQVI